MRNKKYIYLVFFPAPGTKLQKPLEFPKGREPLKVSCYVQEGSSGKLLGHFQDGGWLPGHPVVGLEGGSF